MLEIEWDNLDEAIDELIEKEIEPAVRGLTVLAWHRILNTTPQYHGRLAASWTYSIGQPQYVNRADLMPQDGPERSKGGVEAIDVANWASAGREKAFKLGDVVWFANAADHGEGQYAGWAEEAPASAWREVNRPGRMVGFTLDYIQARWGLDMTQGQAARLAGMSITESSDV